MTDPNWMRESRSRKVERNWGNWSDMRAAFRWDIPERFNIAERCCDSWAALDGARVALTHISQDGTPTDWSYGQLRDLSDRFASVLRASGVEKGDRVAVLLGQGPEVLIAHFAAYKVGAVILPLFTLFGADALAYRLSDSGAKVVVTDRDSLGKITEIRADLPGLQEVFLVDGATDRARDFYAEIHAAPLWPSVRIRWPKIRR